MDFKFEIRKKMWGVILEVTAPNPYFFVNRFYTYAEYDELMEVGVQNKLLELQEELEDALKP